MVGGLDGGNATAVAGGAGNGERGEYVLAVVA
jgi:hypothetical protein